jgi:NFU1 iron-sulfur cluster scaffold homolog, mitochondrial
MTQLSVRFQATPNPNAGKFVLDRKVLEGGGSRSFSSAAHATGDPLAESLFAVPGVASIFMVSDFVTVTKTADAEWPKLVPDIERAIRAALS